ncbi:MAG: hypothetical protein V4579_02085 [Pseudomonadota bacterium]
MYQESAAPAIPPPVVPKVEINDLFGSRRLFGLLGLAFSILLVVAAAFAYRDLRLDVVEQMLPRSWAFWLAVTAYFLHGPLAEWIIFRHLWQVPFFSGIAALLRKLVSNELVFSYLGEVQFYAWARARANLTTAPFGAIKDVAILSALTGNAATVIMLVLAWPLVAAGNLGMPMKSVFLSLGVVLLTSCAILVLRKKLFSLDRRELWFITAIHVVRIVLFITLSAVMWHLVLPQVPLGLWLVLATLRMLVSRLPLLPNKDLVFAGIAVFLLGQDVEIAALMTMMAAIFLASNIVVGVGFGLVGMLETRRNA